MMRIESQDFIGKVKNGQNRATSTPSSILGHAQLSGSKISKSDHGSRGAYECPAYT